MADFYTGTNPSLNTILVIGTTKLVVSSSVSQFLIWIVGKSAGVYELLPHQDRE